MFNSSILLQLTALLFVLSCTGCQGLSSLIQRANYAPANKVQVAEGSDLPNQDNIVQPSGVAGTTGQEPTEHVREMRVDPATVEPVVFQESLPEPNTPGNATLSNRSEQLQHPNSGFGSTYRRPAQPFTEPQVYGESFQGTLDQSYSNNGTGPVYEGTELNRPRQKPATEIALELQVKNRRLYDEKLALQEENRRLRQHLSQLNSQLARRQDEVVNSLNTIHQMTTERSEMKDQIERLKNQLVVSNARHQKDIEELSRAIVAFEELLDDANGDALQQRNEPADVPDQPAPSQPTTENIGQAQTNQEQTRTILSPPQTFSVLEQPMDSMRPTAEQLLQQKPRPNTQESNE